MWGRWMPASEGEGEGLQRAAGGRERASKYL